MDAKKSEEIQVMNSDDQEGEIMMEDLRRGPWTVEEDFALINYITQHGEGRWNSLARSAGLKRTGKSCRLRWLNYLRPDIRRGNITLEEQLLILELHSRWGSRWSKIAQHLPGRTDNEIKNYWRTRVQKHAKQLKCDVNSKQFKDTMRYLWMPRLVERIQAASTTAATSSNTDMNTNDMGYDYGTSQMMMSQTNSMYNNLDTSLPQLPKHNASSSYMPENSGTTGSSDSFGRSQVSPGSDCYHYPQVNYTNPNEDPYYPDHLGLGTESIISPTGYFNEFQSTENNPWMDGRDLSDNMWSTEDIWLLSQQFNII